MVIKSVPIDDMNIVIFAIRGSQTFMDWAVNLNSAPVSPSEFLVSFPVLRVGGNGIGALTSGRMIQVTFATQGSFP